jgi:hypothetical protein
MSTISTDPYVTRIQALLDKAESTTFPSEAEALVAKAQELMARHAIDEAMLAGAAGSRDEVDTTQIVVAPPYASAKVSLVSAAAQANRCRVVVSKGPSGTQHCTVVGFPEDLGHVRTLFTSLSVQATRFLLHAQVPPGDAPRRFRHAFLLAFGQRVGERLREAERQATLDAQAERDERGVAAGEPSVAVVLASRAKQVDDHLARRFGRLRTRSASVSSAAGWHGGRRAADRASLGGRPLGGPGRALGSG